MTHNKKNGLKVMNLSTTMSTSDLVTITNAYLHVWDTGKFTLLENIITDDFVRHSQWEGNVRGREALMQVITNFRNAKPGAAFHPIDDADVVVRGNFMWVGGAYSLPDSNEPHQYQGMARFKKGVLAEFWVAEDALLLMDLLGVIALTTQAE